MANLANELEECFGSVDLYAILKISKEASQSESKRNPIIKIYSITQL